MRRVNAVWGYKELLDLAHYEALIEMGSDAQEIFAKRKQEMDEYEGLSAHSPLKSLVYQDQVDQPQYFDTLKGFLEKYLNGKTEDQKFAWLYQSHYEQLIDYKKLTAEEESIMKEFRTVVENYAPDHINPKRVYSNEEEVRAAAQKALTCINGNSYLAFLR